MIVITLTKVPQSLRGDLTKWCQEVQTGVYVGSFSARIRDLLWKRILLNIERGEATLIYTTNNELGYDFKTTRKDKQVVQFDGIPLMMHLKNQSSTNKRKLGFSTAAHYHRANTLHKKSNEKDVLSSIVALDIETTGLDITKDQIISIGAVKYISKSKCERFYRLIKTDYEIPTHISKITQLTSEKLNQSGIELFDALEDLKKFLADRLIVGYNLNFDINFLNRDYQKYNNSHILNNLKDILPIIKNKNKFIDNYKLNTVLKNYGIKNAEPHNALSDACATLDLIIKLVEQGSF